MQTVRIIQSNELAYVIRDAYPVTHLHSLIIPKRHVQSYFDLYQSEVNACIQLQKWVKDDVGAQDPMVRSFNIGINDGAIAGQTIFHCHIHLIPRRQGDADEFRGGIRRIIPGKGSY
jgi:ATP adenylyltransferase